MVGIVVVSHSARLAEGVVELAREMAGDEVPIEAAGGLDEPGEPSAPTRSRVVAAIRSGDAADGGTLVLMDLGSAVLSAETALDFLDDEARARVRLLEAPLVEGAVAAAAAARAGASLDEVAAEARRGLAGKQAHLGGPDAAGAPPRRPTRRGRLASATAVVGGAHGLHARPAAAVVRTVAGLDAEVRAGEPHRRARSRRRTQPDGARRPWGRCAATRCGSCARGPDAAEAAAAVAGLVSRGRRRAPPAPPPPRRPPPRRRRREPGEELRGVPASPGRAAGPARRAGAPRRCRTRPPGRPTRSRPPCGRRARRWGQS